MRQPDSFSLDTWADERVEAFIDGDLPADEAALFRAALGLGAAEEPVLLARKVREGLRTLPQPACSPLVAERVLRHARESERASRLARMREAFGLNELPSLRPALTMAFLVLVVVSAALIGRPVRTDQDISQAEVQQALADAKWALARISQAGRRTGSAVRDEVLAPHVVAPMREAVGAALDSDSNFDTE